MFHSLKYFVNSPNSQLANSRDLIKTNESSDRAIERNSASKDVRKRVDKLTKL